MMKRNGALGKVLVGVLVGGGAVWLSSLAVSRVEALQKYPFIAPAVLAGAAFLLYKRGRHASALGLAGAVGVLGLFMLQSKGYLQLPGAQSDSSQTAGYGDAGRMMGGGAYSGWREQAGMLAGSDAPRILAEQNAMGVGDAGAIMGSGSRRLISAQDAMGFPI
jgi:hypothetical protein